MLVESDSVATAARAPFLTTSSLVVPCHGSFMLKDSSNMMSNGARSHYPDRQHGDDDDRNHRVLQRLRP